MYYVWIIILSITVQFEFCPFVVTNEVLPNPSSDLSTKVTLQYETQFNASLTDSYQNTTISLNDSFNDVDFIDDSLLKSDKDHDPFSDSPSSDEIDDYPQDFDMWNFTMKYSIISTRAAGWKRKFWAITGKYQNLSRKHRNLGRKHISLTSNYHSLSSQFFWFVEEKECADFFREYIPSVEGRFMKNPQFNDTFIIKNNDFCELYSALNQARNKIFIVHFMLKKKFGLKITNVKECSFAYYLTRDEYKTPVEKTIRIKPGSEGNLRNCEMWVYFLYQVYESPDSEDAELQMWYNAIQRYIRRTGNPYPLLVQEVFRALSHSNQYHHHARYHDIIGNGRKKNGTRLAEEEVRCFYKFLLKWQVKRSTHMVSVTPTWTTFVYQNRLNGTPYITEGARESQLDFSEA